MMKQSTTEQPFKQYMCIICGWVYDESQGAEDEGLTAGTRWTDIPDDWICPECGAKKAEFQMIEI